MTKPCSNIARIICAASFGVMSVMTGSLLAVSSANAQSSQHGKTAPAQEATPAPVAPAEAEQAPAAQPAAPEQKQANPLGAGANWETKATSSETAVPAILQEADAVARIRAINDYFNKTANMQGLFLQTDADNTQKRGHFYFERPGKVRFDYSNPSKQKIISDGKYLAIEDHDLKTSDRYPLESTPFRMLLAKEVDFIRDARILGLDETPDTVILTVEDKSEDAGGQIRLFFSKPDLLLKEWLITDAQGLTTKIELQNLELNKTVSADLFKFSDIGLPNFKN